MMFKQGDKVRIRRVGELHGRSGVVVGITKPNVEYAVELYGSDRIESFYGHELDEAPPLYVTTFGVAERQIMHPDGTITTEPFPPPPNGEDEDAD